MDAADLKISYGGTSLAGARDANQDAFAASPPDRLKGAVAVIADGLSSGELAAKASQTAVTEFIDEYLATPDTWTVKTSAARVLNALNRWFCHHDGMATTVSAVVAKGRTAHIFHVGDSRVHRFRDGDLEQLTRDHRRQAMLTNALGAEVDLEVDYLAEDLVAGDVFVLTTDGVHDSLPVRDLRERVACATAGNAALEIVSRAVVDAARRRGSEDNLSCLLVRVDGTPDEDIDEAHRRLTRQVIPPVLRPDSRIDGYRVVRTVASGMRSHIYLVEDPSGQRLALKAPSESLAEDAVYLDGFIREEWIGKRIDHPGVMKILPRPESRFLYYVAEYIEGRSLRQWMLDNPRPAIDEVRRLVGEIAKGLRAFQRLQMVHRDLKPENVMIDRDGNAKVVDFGTAYVQGFDELEHAVRETHPVRIGWLRRARVPVGSVGHPCRGHLRLGDRGLRDAGRRLALQTAAGPRCEGVPEPTVCAARRGRPRRPAEMGGPGAGQGDGSEPGQPLRGPVRTRHGPNAAEPGTGAPCRGGTPSRGKIRRYFGNWSAWRWWSCWC